MRPSPHRRFEPAAPRRTPEEGSAARLERALRDRGARPTRQRRALYAALHARCDHPTAEALHRAVRRRVRRLSLATVYSALDVLVDSGLVGRVAGPDGVARYDARTDPHDHRRCLGCGRIEDMERPAQGLCAGDYDTPGFRAVDCRVEVLGYCAACSVRGGAGMKPAGPATAPRARKGES